MTRKRRRAVAGKTKAEDIVVAGRIRLTRGWPVPALMTTVVVLSGGCGRPGPEPGISLELARHRAATLSDVRYDVALDVPVDADSPVTGTVAVTFEKADESPLVLDFAAPAAVSSVTLDGAAVSYQGRTDHVVVPVPSGRRTVTLRFTAGDGPLNRRDAFLYSLFVPDRAHEAVPVFDQPDVKARFRLELTVPAGWTAIANGAVVERRLEGERVAYRFAETEPIPTYLFAFAAGRFKVEKAERAGRRLRLIHRETDSTKVARNVETLFDLHATALAWLESYTGIPYPFAPFDFVAIPSFQYSGMEHPGAVLYRASSLFLDESATRNRELSRASLIAHETAHMWFGDLVTMRWFDDVWMKEVFANFMAARIVNPSFPELDHELRFLLAHYPPAYSVDRTPGANPIRQPLENLDEAGSLYGAIIYQKAPIVMRQLERLTGPEAFRRAIRSYLTDHAFGNATWTDLVEALDREAEMDVAAWSRVWIEEPGRPWVRVAVSSGPDPARLAVVQQDPRGRGLVWDQVLDLGLVADSVARERAVRFDTDSTTVAVPAGVRAVLPNASGLAYGLFFLDPGTVDVLLTALPSLEPAVARAAAWLDLWELMLEGQVDAGEMFDLARRLVAEEEDELIVQQVLDDLTDLFWRYVTPATRDGAAHAVEGLLWERMLAAESSSEKAAYLNAWRVLATTPEAVDRMEAVWRGDLGIDGLPLSERDRTTLALNLAVREVPGWDGILDGQAERIENPDRRERFAFIRPAVSADPAVRDSFFTSLADPANRAREEWVVTALGYLHHPLRARSSIGYIRPALERLEEVRATGDIFFPTRWLQATLSGHATTEAAAIVQRFIAENPDLPPRLMAKLLQEADPLFRAAVVRSAGAR